MDKLVDHIPKSYWEDRKWAYRHLNDLIPRYPNRWVAIYRKKVIASGESSIAVEKRAKEISGRAENPLMFVEKGCHIYEN